MSSSSEAIPKLDRRVGLLESCRFWAKIDRFAAIHDFLLKMMIHDFLSSWIQPQSQVKRSSSITWCCHHQASPCDGVLCVINCLVTKFRLAWALFVRNDFCLPTLTFSQTRDEIKRLLTHQVTSICQIYLTLLYSRSLGSLPDKISTYSFVNFEVMSYSWLCHYGA